ncbi:hypothetical protein AM499_06445 [Bacillus sp. FJAT-22090]|nr:hypothetical protein AM499_06445 [Bacillus sp. FJAT-22090]
MGVLAEFNIQLYALKIEFVYRLRLSFKESLFKKGSDTMEQWFSLIQDVGFPIFVSFYLMHRVEGKLEEIKIVLLSLK